MNGMVARSTYQSNVKEKRLALVDAVMKKLATGTSMTMKQQTIIETKVTNITKI